MVERKQLTLEQKPETELRIYAYSIQDAAHEGQLKIGQTTQGVANRVSQQLQTANIQNYTIELDKSAHREDGTIFSDTSVRKHLQEKGFEKVDLEWMRCTTADVLTAIQELKTGEDLGLGRNQDFKMRLEQESAVEKTVTYFKSVWNSKSETAPRFLWNAKMRFGKTFTSYKLVERLEAKKILVLTFKPAVEDSWKSDLYSHVDFKNWKFLTEISDSDLSLLEIDESDPIVYFGSFQDVLGRDRDTGTIKAKNEWIHTTNWDLVIFDEYHFGAWRESVKELFEGEDPGAAKSEIGIEYGGDLAFFDEARSELSRDEDDFLPITTKAYLYLSGTPFRAIGSGEFVEDQIFNWTYTDEQQAKESFASKYPEKHNPYGALPSMSLLTYQMPEELIAIANQGEFNEFDLNSFFGVQEEEGSFKFTYANEVQKFLNIIRGTDSAKNMDDLKTNRKAPFPYEDVALLSYTQHSIWFLPNVGACHAMAELLQQNHNTFWHDYDILIVAGKDAGLGAKALPPVKTAIGKGLRTKTITLTCGKLMTGVTVPQWSSILMLRNLQSPETYFQAAFRVQSPWSIKNPNGDNPDEEEIMKPNCYIFDFAPTRALRQVAEYSYGLSPRASNPESAVSDLLNFLPVLAYDGSEMLKIDAGALLDLNVSGTSAGLLARKWQSALLVNVDNDTLKKIINNKNLLDTVMRIEGFKKLNSDIFERVVNLSEGVTKKKKEKKEKGEKREMTKEEKEYKALRKEIQEKLIQFATRIPTFMYLTDYREYTLQDVITKLEPDLFKSVTGLSVNDFHMLTTNEIFNPTHINQAIFAFKRFEDPSLTYTGIQSGEGSQYGLFDTVVSANVTGE